MAIEIVSSIKKMVIVVIVHSYKWWTHYELPLLVSILWLFMVSFPIINGDFPVRYVTVIFRLGKSH